MGGEWAKLPEAAQQRYEELAANFREYSSWKSPMELGLALDVQTKLTGKHPRLVAGDLGDVPEMVLTHCKITREDFIQLAVKYSSEDFTDSAVKKLGAKAHQPLHHTPRLSSSSSSPSK